MAGFGQKRLVRNASGQEARGSEPPQENEAGLNVSDSERSCLETNKGYGAVLTKTTRGHASRLLCSLLLLGLASASLAQIRQHPSRARSHRPDVTFSNQIVRLFQDRCQACHHPGGSAPFSLVEYREAWLYSGAINDAVRRRYMPPWKAIPGFGEFQYERRLTDRELQLIVRWVDSGAPEGDPRQLPAPLEFPAGWPLGEPDLILSSEARYVPVRGERDDLRCFSLPTNLPSDSFLNRIEIHPGAAEPVHHVSLAADYTGISASFGDPQDPQPGYDCFGGVGFASELYLGTWVPGTDPQELASGLAYPLPAGARIVMQVHYHLDDTSVAGLTRADYFGEPRVSGGAKALQDGKSLLSDRTRVGLYFSNEPSPQPLLTLFFEKSDFVIPAGEPRHVITKSIRLGRSAKPTLYNVLPHMHLLGREMRLDLIPPEGDTKTLNYIDDWVDFPADPECTSANDNDESADPLANPEETGRAAGSSTAATLMAIVVPELCTAAWT